MPVVYEPAATTEGVLVKSLASLQIPFRLEVQ